MQIYSSEQDEQSCCLVQGAAIQALIPGLRVAARDLVDGAAFSPDDLVREALAVALRSWDQLPSGGDLKPWLLGVLSEPGLVKRPEQLSAPPVERG
jgi:DNA-directed RNA polymerase specialized sigma24 family protein